MYPKGDSPDFFFNTRPHYTQNNKTAVALEQGRNFVCVYRSVSVSKVVHNTNRSGGEEGEWIGLLDFKILLMTKNKLLKYLNI